LAFSTPSRSARLQLPGSNLQPGFTLSGLGALAEAALSCERLVQFRNADIKRHTLLLIQRLPCPYQIIFITGRRGKLIGWRAFSSIVKGCWMPISLPRRPVMNMIWYGHGRPYAGPVTSKV
jgi:hypothetical protein